MSFKTVRSLGEVIWHHKKLTPRQTRFLSKIWANTHKRRGPTSTARVSTGALLKTSFVVFLNNKGKKRKKTQLLTYQKRKLAHFYGSFKASLQSISALGPRATKSHERTSVSLRETRVDSVPKSPRFLEEKREWSSTQSLKKKVFRRKAKSFLNQLEARLDVVLVRAQLCSTLRRARQWIQHGHICVNNRSMVFSGYCLQPGDSISIAKHFQKQYQQHINQIRTLKQVVLVQPSHLEINYKLHRILFLYEAKHVFFPYKIDIERASS